MVQIGNYDLSLDSLLPSGVVGIAKSLMIGLIIFIAVGLICWGLYIWFRNRTKYSIPVTLLWQYENGTNKTITGMKGGKYVNRSGIMDFRVKIPKQLRAKEIGYIPDFSKADSDGTIHFITSGDGILWQQIEHKVVEKEIRDKDGVQYEYELLQKPIPADVKTSTMNSIKSFSEMVNKQKVTIIAIGLGMFIIMVIAHLVSLYIQTKIRCPAEIPALALLYLQSKWKTEIY